MFAARLLGVPLDEMTPNDGDPMTTINLDRSAEPHSGMRVPIGPFPARVRLERDRLVLEVVVGQMTGPVDLEPAVDFTVEVLRELFGSSVNRPEAAFDPRSKAVTICYECDFDAAWEEVVAMTMAGTLFASYLVIRLAHSLTPEWRVELTARRVLGAGRQDPRRLVGSFEAPWAPWDEEERRGRLPEPDPSR